MSDVMRVKGSNQIVYRVGASNEKYTTVLFPFGRESKKGERGVVQKVRNDKLTLEKTYGYG
jgi:adenine-specific DNA methylase